MNSGPEGTIRIVGAAAKDNNNRKTMSDKILLALLNSYQNSSFANIFPQQSAKAKNYIWYTMKTIWMINDDSQ